MVWSFTECSLSVGQRLSLLQRNMMTTTTASAAAAATALSYTQITF